LLQKTATLLLQKTTYSLSLKAKSGSKLCFYKNASRAFAKGAGYSLLFHIFAFGVGAKAKKVLKVKNDRFFLKKKPTVLTAYSGT
jgi:hypothetical protein